MRGFGSLILGVFGTLAFSWVGLNYIPNFQIGHLDPQTDEDGNDAYPAPQSGMAARGERVYIANGCFYCHSQQVRADYAGSDIERKWGDRRSAPRDYIFERPVLLGQMRLGPDLSNVGKRTPVQDENAPPNASPAAGNPQSANPGSPPPASAGSAAPGASPPATSGAASASPAAAKSASSPAPAPVGQASSPAPTAGAPAQPIAQNQPSPAGPAQSPQNNTPGTSTSANNPAAAALAGTSTAMQQSVAAVAGAASSAEGSRSANLPPYSAPWHHRHLYAPRSLNDDSIMPSYKFLYEKRRVGGQPSDEALTLPGADSPGQGWEVVPTYDAKCLVAYLMSLDQSHALKEVKSAAPPAPPAPGKAAK